MNEQEVIAILGQLTLAQFQLRKELELEKTRSAALQKHLDEMQAELKKLKGE